MLDMKAYMERSQHGPCFICEILAGNPEYYHHIIFENENVIAFLNKYPPLFGYTLVAPKSHKVGVTSDFSVNEYLDLQGYIYKVAETVRLETEVERVYILSLGSMQGNSHVHLHIAPLPVKVPYEKQQLEALSMNDGYLDIPEEELFQLAERLRIGIQCLLAS
jgi:diadenosine tetraphosphate (Ap4A) HIT family hydrolase